MPYYVENTPPLEQIAGLASAYFNIKNQLQQQKLENQKQQADIQYQQQEEAASKTSQAATRQQYGLGSNDQPLPHPQYAPQPTAEKGKPTDYGALYNWATTNALSAYQAGDQNSASFYNGLATSYQKMYEDQGLTQLHEAEVPYYGARTQLTAAQTKNATNLFPHQIDMLRQRGVNAEDVARIHAAYRRAGGGRSGNTAEAEQRAEYAAMNEAARVSVDAQNALQNQIYRFGMEEHESNPEQYPNAPQAPQMMPIPIYVPGPNGQPTIIQIGPNGQPVAPQRAAPQTQRPTSRPAPPKQTSQGGGFNPIQAAEDWWHQHFGGGGSQPRIVQHNPKTGEYRHSTDGGKTWVSGP